MDLHIFALALRLARYALSLHGRRKTVILSENIHKIKETPFSTVWSERNVGTSPGNVVDIVTMIDCSLLLHLLDNHCYFFFR